MKLFSRLFPQLSRLLFINRILIRHNLDEFVYAIPLFRPLGFIYHLSPWNWNKNKPRAPRGERIRKALEDLGPVFVKFGQVLSTRRDLLPEDLADELAKLQDDVPPFCGEEARKIIEKSLEKPVSELFKTFDETPLASASIAQVHTATLPGGEDVIVKVVRPGIEKTIRHDIDLMYLIARMVHRFSDIGKRLRPVEVVEEYEKTIIDELDLAREAANASQLRRNSKGKDGQFDDIYVPEIYWDYCVKDVLVMERIYGIPIGDIARLKANGTNMKVLGERGVEIFFTQVFTYNFFHADMHPGNIFVDENNPENPRYLAVDFGIVGTLTPEDQRYLAENLHAFFNRDYKRVAEAHIESGWVPPETKANEFEAAIRTVCEPIFQLPIKEISYGKLLLRLFQTARRFNMEVQPQLVLLQKTLLNIEGMGRELYPDLDLWATAKPFLQRWMDEQVGIRHLFKGAKQNLPKFIEQLPHMPVMVNEVIRQMHDKELNMQLQSSQLEELRKEIKAANRKTLLTITGATLIISAVLANSALLTAPATTSSLSFFSLIIGGSGLALLIYALTKR
jgi:ubiquinone biosynthesis protein